jgi:hypothetical protein
MTTELTDKAINGTPIIIDTAAKPYAHTGLKLGRLNAPAEEQRDTVKYRA